MISKLIGIFFSLFLVHFSDLLYGKYIKIKFDSLLQNEGIPVKKRKIIIPFFKAHIDLLAYISSAIAAIVTVSLGYSLQLEKFKNIIGWEFNKLNISEIAFLVRSLVPVFILIVIAKSFLMLPNDQPGKLQKISIWVTCILLLIEMFGII